MKRAGIVAGNHTLTPYSFRPTCATLPYLNNGDLEAIRRYLRHLPEDRRVREHVGEGHPRCVGEGLQAREREADATCFGALHRSKSTRWGPCASARLRDGQKDTVARHPVEVSMTTPTDASMTDTTSHYFKERYAPLYRYADAVETVAIWAAVAIVSAALFAGCTGLDRRMRLWGGEALVWPVVGVVLACTCAAAVIVAARLVAAAVRAFADMVVSNAPCLDDESRLAIIRGSAATTTGPAQEPPREITDIMRDVAMGMSAGRARAALPPHDLTMRDDAVDAPAATRTAPVLATPAPVTRTAEAPRADAVGTGRSVTPSQAAPPTAVEEGSWYLAQDGEPTGPWTEAQLGQGVRQGSVTAASLVWRVGDDAGWVRLDADPTLRRMLPAPR
jgi:hypothetical protein